MINYLEFSDKYKDELTRMILLLYSEDCGEATMNTEKIFKTIDFLSEYSERGKIILFEINSEIVGYSILVNFWSNEYGGLVLLIDELFIKNNYRNRGIGTGFINKLINNENKEHAALFLEVLPSNNKAYSFYLRNGFTQNANRSLRYIFQ